ncbi:MAG: hypothetical protein U9M92_01895 [Patescibacteria group bacterium]|nr:hypothetical protein [Patescibacteria group bacterium]
MDILAKLFGGAVKVKLMRLFLLNSDLVLSSKEVSKRIKAPAVTTSRELGKLANIDLLHKTRRASSTFWRLDPTFPFNNQLRQILKNNLLGYKRDLARKFGTCGRLYLLVMSGIFIDQADSRADLLIVGSQMKRGAVDRLVKKFEAEIGKELTYALLETTEFKYRLDACDKFIRDVLDFPHEIVIDKIGL